MAEFDVIIENLFHEKVRLYSELLEILKEEKKSLLEADVNAIWKFSNQKQSAATEIEKIRSQILTLLNDASINHTMNVASFRASTVVALVPENLSRKLEPIRLELNEIKDAVQQTVKMNKAFVEEYLGFMHEFVDIIASVGCPKPVYTNGRYMEDSSKKCLLLNKEV